MCLVGNINFISFIGGVTRSIMLSFLKFSGLRAFFMSKSLIGLWLTISRHTLIILVPEVSNMALLLFPK